MKSAINLSKEQIIAAALEIVECSGWDSLNARGLAKKLGISTKPLYRIYNNMEEINKDLYKAIYHKYDAFITSRVDSKKALLSMCTAYVEFAKIYPKLFVSLFLSNNLEWKSIENVLDEKWNQSIIINLVNKKGLSFDEAKTLFINMWLYVNGLATLIATNDITLNDEEILSKILKIYELLSVDFVKMKS